MDTPSSRLVAAAEVIVPVVDAQGRVLAVRRLGALDRLRLFKAAGAGLGANAGWMGMATLACSVTAIDDVPVPAPASEAQIEVLVARLGDVGIAAVAAVLSPVAQGGETSPGELAKN